MAFVTTTIFRVIISIDLITTVGSVGCYILLLPACKLEMRVKKQFFWQEGDDFMIRLMPAWCGSVDINKDTGNNFEALEFWRKNKF